MSLGQIAQGATLSIPLRVMLADGVTPSADFLPTDVLAATVWGGDDTAAVATPAAAWDAVLGPPDYAIVFSPADTAAVPPGVYKVRATATRGSDVPEILRDSIEILSVAGTGAARPSYCTFEDMAQQCSWIGQYLDTDEDQAGFAEQRAEARDWLDELILGAFPSPGIYGGALADGWPTYQGRYTLLSNSWLVGILAGGALVTTTPRGRKAARACACYACAKVFGAMPDQSLLKFAGLYMRKAQGEASTLVIELDINNDGVVDMAIPLGVTNSRFG